MLPRSNTPPAAVRAAALSQARQKLAEALRRQVEEAVARAPIVDEDYDPETGQYEVRLQVTLRSPEVCGTATTTVTPRLREPRYRPGTAAPRDAFYTSVVIDCRGLRVRATPSPKLWSSDGRELFGTVSVEDDFLQDQGIVAYPHSQRELDASPRTGSRPLRLRAIGVRDSTRCEPVLSRSDSARLLQANADDHFLERCAVLFLIDA